MNDNDLFGEIDSYLDTIENNQSSGQTFSLPFPSPTPPQPYTSLSPTQPSPSNTAATSIPLSAPPTPPSSSTPPNCISSTSPSKTRFGNSGLAHSPFTQGECNSPYKTGSDTGCGTPRSPYKSGDFGSSNGAGDGNMSRRSPGHKADNSPAYKPESSPGCMSRNSPGYKPVSSPGYKPVSSPGYKPVSSPGYKPVSSPVQRVSLSARPYSKVCGKRRLDEDFPFPNQQQRSGYPEAMSNLGSGQKHIENRSQNAASFMKQEPSGFIKQELTGYLKQETTGYMKQEPTGFIKQETSVYLKQEATGYMKQEATGYMKQENTGYMKQEPSGYNKQELLRSPDPAALRSPDPGALRSPDPAALRSPDSAALRSPTPAALRSPEQAVLRSPDPAALRSPDPAALRSPDPAALRLPDPSGFYSTNNNNDTNAQCVDPQQRETIKTKILGVLEATGLSGNLTPQDIRTLKRLSEIAKSTELTQHQKAQEVGSLIRYNPNIHRLLVTLKNDKHSPQRINNNQNELKSADGNCNRPVSVITCVPGSMPSGGVPGMPSRKSSLQSLLEGGQPTSGSGIPVPINRQSVPGRGQAIPAIEQSIPVCNNNNTLLDQLESFNQHLSSPNGETTSDFGSLQTSNPNQGGQLRGQLPYQVESNYPQSNSGEGFPGSSPRISNTMAPESSTSTLTSLLASPSIQPGMSSPSYQSSSKSLPNPNQQFGMNSSPHQQNSTLYQQQNQITSPQFQGSGYTTPALTVPHPQRSPVMTTSHPQRSPGHQLHGGQRSRSMLGSPGRQKPVLAGGGRPGAGVGTSQSWSRFPTPSGNFLSGYPGSPRGQHLDTMTSRGQHLDSMTSRGQHLESMTSRGMIEADLRLDPGYRNQAQGFFPGIYPSHGPVRPFMPSHLHPDHRQIYMERTGIPMGYIDPADPNYGRRPPGYMGGSRLHYEASSRIPLPGTAGPVGVGYRPSMYIMDQDCYQMGPSQGMLEQQGGPRMGPSQGMLEQQSHPHYARGGMINPQHHLEINSPAGGNMIPGQSPVVQSRPGINSVGTMPGVSLDGNPMLPGSNSGGQQQPSSGCIGYTSPGYNSPGAGGNSFGSPGGMIEPPGGMMEPPGGIMGHSGGMMEPIPMSSPSQIMSSQMSSMGSQRSGSGTQTVQSPSSFSVQSSSINTAQKQSSLDETIPPIRPKYGESSRLFQELSELPLNRPPDTSMLLKDQWKAAATEKRVRYLERLEKSLASSGVPAYQVAGIASNMEKDAFLKAETESIYESKLIANLASYMPQNSDDQPDSTTIVDSSTFIPSSSSSNIQDVNPECNQMRADSQTNIISATFSDYSTQHVQNSEVREENSMLSPSITFTSNGCTPGNGNGNGNNYPSSSQNCSSVGPGSTSNLPGTSGSQKPGNLQTGGSSSGSLQPVTTTTTLGLPQPNSIHPPSFFQTKFQDWNKTHDPSSVDSGIGSPRSSCPNICSPKVNSASPHQANQEDTR